jgi:hypothetical protein
VENNKRRGIRWTLTSMLGDIEFADDIALPTSTLNHLQKKTNDLYINSKQIGLNINKIKTKTMQIHPSPTLIKQEPDGLRRF